MADDVRVTQAGRPEPLPEVAPTPTRSKPGHRLLAAMERRAPERAGATGLSSAAMRAGDLVRGMRRGAGLSQAALADRIGVTQARIAEIEAGTGTQGPTWDVMERIAAACGREVGVLPAAPAMAPVEEPAEVDELLAWLRSMTGRVEAFLPLPGRQQAGAFVPWPRQPGRAGAMAAGHDHDPEQLAAEAWAMVAGQAAQGGHRPMAAFSALAEAATTRARLDVAGLRGLGVFHGRQVFAAELRGTGTGKAPSPVMVFQPLAILGGGTEPVQD